jgi:hypothetical protein
MKVFENDNPIHFNAYYENVMQLFADLDFSVMHYHRAVDWSRGESAGNLTNP